MAAARCRHAFSMLLILLMQQFAEPTLKTRRATAEETSGQQESPSSWQKFIRKIHKPFRTMDSALFLLGGSRRGSKPDSDMGRPPDMMTSYTTSSSSTPESTRSMWRMIMDPGDRTTPTSGSKGETKPTTVSPPRSGDVATWNLQRLSTNPCGASPANITDGEMMIFLGQFPWMALLRYTAKDESMHNLCGGSLISDRYVLTAASCLDVPDHKLTSVRLGEYNLDFDDSDCSDVDDGLSDVVAIEACYGEPPVDYPILYTHAHPEYDSASGKHNVGLIRLAKKVKYTPLISPVCLPVGDMVINWNGGNAETDLILAGWGDNVVPREAFVVQADPLDCQDAIGDEVSAGQMCGSGQNGSALCHGDVGDSLFAMKKMREPPRDDSGNPRAPAVKKYVQLGVLVSKSPYCEDSPPIIFDGVEGFLSWILKTMKP